MARLCWFLLYLMIISYIFVAAVPKSGSYIVKIVRVGACQNYTGRFPEHPLILQDIQLYNTTKKVNLLRGNVTVTRNEFMSVKLKNFVWEQGRWKLAYLYNNASCKSPWLVALLRMMGIEFKNCSLKKGVHVFEGIDTAMIKEVWSFTRETGRSLWRAEGFSRGRLESCWESEISMEPES